MYRIEIISNKSVEDDITEILEEHIPDILYTTVPLVYGKGGNARKLGTTTWPETNFVMVSYIKDNELPVVKAVIKAVKEKFNGEGIKLFVVKAEEI